MNFFKKNILKIKSEVEEDSVSFYINYFKLKELDNFKISLFNKLMGSNNCLAIINTEMKYNKNNYINLG